MAKSYLIPLALLCCTACFSRPSLMTYSDYNSVQVGSSITKIETEIGKPYAVHTKKDGTVEYEYIERIDAGSTIVAENHYFLIIQDGKVVGKYMNRERPPAYDLIYQEEPNYPGNP